MNKRDECVILVQELRKSQTMTDLVFASPTLALALDKELVKILELLDA